MKKWKKVVVAAGLAFGLTAVVKMDADAASKITKVQQIDAGTHNVKISWDASLEAERYVIEFSDDLLKWVEMDDTSSTEAYVSSLSSGTTYYVRVTGYKDWSFLRDTGTVCADASDPVEIVTAPDVNNMSVSQSDATKSGFSVKFNGGSNSGANYYCVYLSGTDIPVGESATPEVTISGKLETGTSYWCNAYACRKSSTGFVAQGSRSYEKFTTLSGKIGRSDFSMNKNMAYQLINTYYFDIVNTTSVDGYQLQFLNTSGKAKKTFTQSGTSFRVPNLIHGTFYQYRVRTYVDCGTKKVYSPWSDCRYVGITGKVTTNSRSSALKFNWSKVAGATKYDVYMSASANSGYKKIKTAKAGSRNVSLTKFNGKKIQKGKKYYIRIFAYGKVNGKTVKTELPWAGYYIRY